MMALTPYIGTMGIASISAGSADRYTSVRQEAGRLYRRVALQAWLGHLWTALAGRPRHLAALADHAGQGKFTSRHDGGNRTVAVAAIRGSENRSRDFDSHFRPLNLQTADRWESVAGALLIGAALPAVDLIQVGDDYFVRDGHHRVSAARALGQGYVDASVTVWEGEQA